MNFDLLSFLIGLLAGWLLEWIIDWLYWRRGRVSAGDVAALQEQLDAAQARTAELEASLEAARTDLDSWQARYNDLEAEHVELGTVRGELEACQTSLAELQSEFEKQSAENAELQNLVSAARIQAIGRLTAVDGINESDAGRLVDAGISSADELLLADDGAVQVALGLDDPGFDAWSMRVKAGLAALGLGVAATHVLEEEEDDEGHDFRTAGIELEDDLDAIEEQPFPEIEGELIVEEVLETYDFDEDGEVDMVVDSTIEGLDLDHDGEIDIVLDELIEADILDEEAIAGMPDDLAELEELEEVALESEIEETAELAELEESEEFSQVAARAAIIGLAEQPDDLKLIQGIGPRFSEKLAASGIATFAALAAASDDELDDAIEPQNWQKLDYESWRAQARTFAEVTPAQIEGDNLQQIEGIGPKYSQLLKQADILTFAELADTEPERLAEIIGAPAWRRVDYDSWIAQAGLAAAGNQDALLALQDELHTRDTGSLLLIHGLGETYAAAFREAGVETLADVAAQTPEGLEAIALGAGLRRRDFEAWIDEAQQRAAGKRVARAARAYADAVNVSCPQDLESIEGVGVVYERRLFEAGVGSYWEVAQLSDEALSDILEVMPFQDVDLAAMRASAMALAIETGTVNHVWDGSSPDDFEPLEGIGVIYERRLYNAGYCTYEALASATPEELEKVCRPPAFHKPDFAGWIAAARELAAVKGADEE
ncbi:MAG: helix-hairpin-helix domain-containing protein [Candidatus Promineifilaceae bacterium]